VPAQESVFPLHLPPSRQIPVPALQPQDSTQHFPFVEWYVSARKAARKKRGSEAAVADQAPPFPLKIPHRSVERYREPAKAADETFNSHRKPRHQIIQDISSDSSSSTDADSDSTSERRKSNYKRRECDTWGEEAELRQLNRDMKMGKGKARDDGRKERKHKDRGRKDDEDGKRGKRGKR
jgi:hypothetical protein